MSTKKGAMPRKTTLEMRKKILGNGTIIVLADGYRGLVGFGGLCTVAYIELPEGHPDVGKDYNDLDPNVNGGLTYANDRVFGWDYGHAYNRSDPETDTKNALRYFKQRGGQR